MPTPKKVLTWHRAVIPYVLDNHKLKDDISSAMKTWAHATPLRFVQRTSEKSYVRFASGTDHGNTTSHTGYVPNSVTTVHLAEGYLATHELGHVLGLIHEQCRSDRDSYVKILWENVRNGHNNSAFTLNSDSNNQGLSYDPESVMQYGKSWQTSNGKDTQQWIGDTSQGIHKTNGWTKLTANDVQAANRFYRQEFPGQDDLVMYRSSSGYVNTSFTTAENGIAETWAAHWSKGYTLMATYQSSGKPHLVIYNGSTGYVNTNVIHEDGSITELWNAFWHKGYTLMATYQSGGKPHLVIYNKSGGYVNTNRINEDGSIDELWNAFWSEGYTLIATYQVGGKPHLVIYKGSSGYINTNRINENGSIDELRNAFWSECYSLIATYQSEGRPGLVIYGKSSGYINTNRINENGSIDELWNAFWSKDYTLMATYQVHGSPHLIAYRKSSGYVNTNDINVAGQIYETWNTHWSEDYTLMATVPTVEVARLP